MSDEPEITVDVREEEISTVKEALEQVRQKNTEGLLKAADVVEEAKDVKSPLHKHIYSESDEKAAYQHRLWKARILINKMQITMSKIPVGTQQPMYVSLSVDRSKKGGGYRATSDVVKSPYYLKQLEETAKMELEAWSRRNALLTELVRSVRMAAGLPIEQEKETRDSPHQV